MIGNDIIDLDSAFQKKRSTDNRFLNKIFTKNEINLILNSKNSEKAIWILWSWKESAYKTIIKNGTLPFFAPKQLICKSGNFANFQKEHFSGIVEFKNQNYDVVTYLNSKYIHSISSDSRTEKHIYQDIFPIKNDQYSTQHQTVYKKLLATAARITQLPVDQLSIKKSKNGIPFVYHQNQKLDLDVSMSHDGKYGGIVAIKKCATN